MTQSEVLQLADFLDDPGTVMFFSLRNKAAEELRRLADVEAQRDALLEALVMVRDADEDCKRDGLPTIPPAARAKIDAAIAKAEGA